MVETLHSPAFSLSLNPFKENHPPQFRSNPRLTHFPPSVPPRTHPQRLIVCARKRKRGSGSPRRLWNNLPRLLSFVASNSNMLPEPLDAVMEGGESWGGGLWECVKGWRRSFKGGKPKLGSFWVWLGFGMCGCCLLYFGRELSNGVVLGVLGFGALVAGVLGSGTRRVVKDLILGVVLFGALLGLGFRRSDMQKWVGRIRGCAPVLELVKGRKTRKW